MEVARGELRSDVARRLVLFGENMASSAAVDAGVFDEAADADALLQRALAKAAQFVALTQSAFARTKRQLRRAAVEAIETAIAGAEPLLDNWLSRETITAATTVLAGKA
jgi:enoyl-CoA hydratase/carnithine racemase